MDDTLLKYDESLEALERQRESLELVMKRMGAEWEESGAGIGWMGDILSNSSASYTDAANTSSYSASSSSSSSLALKSNNPPLFHVMQTNPAPSHDYLQTLLNVNDELLAQSLASSAQGYDSASNNSNNTREYNITITPPPPPPPLPAASSLNNAFVTQQQQQQQHQLISPPLSEQDSVLHLPQHRRKQGSELSKSSPQQHQLVTPPIDSEEHS